MGHLGKNTTFSGYSLLFRSVQISRDRTAAAAVSDIVCLTVNHSLFRGLTVVFHTVNSIKLFVSGPKTGSPTTDIPNVPAHPGVATRLYRSHCCCTVVAPRASALPVPTSGFVTTEISNPLVRSGVAIRSYCSRCCCTVVAPKSSALPVSTSGFSSFSSGFLSFSYGSPAPLAAPVYNTKTMTDYQYF